MVLGPKVSKPGKSRDNKTGSWRMGKRPKFLQKNCIDCKMCLIMCPEGCISGEGKNTFNCDLEYCKGCGICALLCPKKDIEMISEGKDK
jgi:pyruvate ferredoxin oxidoreductase delta subunit